MSSIEKKEDTITVIDIGVYQEQMKGLVEDRNQVLDVILVDNMLSISTKDEKVEIDTRGVPFLQPKVDGKTWLINGTITSIPASQYAEGLISFPDLSISVDGRLIVDDCSTDFCWSSISLDSISSSEDVIWAIAQVGDYLCFYRSIGLKETIPIVRSSDFIIPDYFMDCMIEKELLAERKIEELPVDDCMSYVFFTDAHWGLNQQHSPAIIKHIIDYTPINQVLFGGDVNTTYTTTVEGTMEIGYAFQNAFRFLGSNFYCLMGNHDDNTTGQAKRTERHLSEEQVYAYLQSQMTTVHYWDYYNFYYDDPVSRTRFMCLDTGRWYERTLRGSTFKTAQFVVECLSTVPDGWHIIAASHIWTNLKSFETGETQESVYVRPIIEILENYNNRREATFSYGGESFQYDFSNSGGMIEYCIGGHTHSDAIAYSQGGLPLITVTCDGQIEVAGGAPYQTGTINEQCVTIIVNDYRSKKVNIYHIGRGEDVSVSMWESPQPFND